MAFQGRIKKDQYFLNVLYFINLHAQTLRVEISTTIDILCFAYMVRIESLKQGVNKKETEEGVGKGRERILNYQSSATGK